MLTVPDNRNEDNPAVADAPTTASAGEGGGSAGADGPQSVPPTLDMLAREGARRMLMTALEAEVTEYVERFAEVRDADGHRLVVRNGQAQERKVTCGAGTWPVRAPRVNDKRVDADGSRERFTSRILPPYMRRSPQVSEVLPLLYLRGLSTGDFREALPALLGEDAAGLSPTTISRLTAVWDEEYQAFRRHDLSGSDYVYVWVDGIHFNIRLEEDRLCTLVVIGVKADGTKELVALEDGYRESQENWASVLRDLRGRGLRAPAVAIGDGALGFWSALRDVWPETTVQRDWCHKLANVLDKLPKRLRPRAKRALRDIMYAPVKADAGAWHRRLRRRVRGEVSEGSGVPGGGPGGAAGVLRLPGGALAPPADVERDRIGVRDGASSAARDQGRGLPHQGAADGLQAGGDGATAMAPAERGAPAAPGPGRRRLRRWRHPDGERGSEGGRLITSRADPQHLTIPRQEAGMGLRHASSDRTPRA